MIFFSINVYFFNNYPFLLVRIDERQLLIKTGYLHDTDKNLWVTLFVENSLVLTVNNRWLWIRPDVSARHQVSVFTPLMLQQVA